MEAINELIKKANDESTGQRTWTHIFSDLYQYPTLIFSFSFWKNEYWTNQLIKRDLKEFEKQISNIGSTFKYDLQLVQERLALSYNSMSKKQLRNYIYLSTNFHNKTNIYSSRVPKKLKKNDELKIKLRILETNIKNVNLFEVTALDLKNYEQNIEYIQKHLPDSVETDEIIHDLQKYIALIKFLKKILSAIPNDHKTEFDDVESIDMLHTFNDYVTQLNSWIRILFDSFLTDLNSELGFRKILENVEPEKHQKSSSNDLVKQSLFKEEDSPESIKQSLFDMLQNINLEIFSLRFKLDPDEQKEFDKISKTISSMIDTLTPITTQNYLMSA